MKNKFLLTISVLFFSLICFTGCDNTDEFTGDSNLEVNIPAVTLNYTHGSVTTLIETDAEYAFTASIAAPIDHDVVLKVDVLNATATQGVDFDVPNEISIRAGSTSASASIEIFADDIIEDEESFTLSIGSRTINGTSTPVQATFNIQNLTTGDLAIGLDWAATGFDFDGSEISPYTLADLRLLVSSGPNNTDIIGGADGGVAESWVLSSATPDGDYYVVADFYAAEDATFDIDLTLTFDQVGVINGQTHTFPGALNGNNQCSSVYYVLAKITKSGDSYSFEEIGTNSPVVATSFVGTATITADDWADYAIGDPIEFEAGANDQEFWIRAYDNPYISNPATAYMIVTVDPATGDATVSSNEPFDYGQGPEGGVSGYGSVNACAGTVQLFITYDLTVFGIYGEYEFSFEL